MLVMEFVSPPYYFFINLISPIINKIIAKENFQSIIRWEVKLLIFLFF